jgi:hypothetical protein
MRSAEPKIESLDVGGAPAPVPDHGGAIGAAQRDSQILSRQKDQEPFTLNAFE